MWQDTSCDAHWVSVHVKICQTNTGTYLLDKGNIMPFDLKSLQKALKDFATFGKSTAGIFQELPKFFGYFGAFSKQGAENTKNAFQLPKKSK